MPRTQRCSPRHGQSVSPRRPDTANPRTQAGRLSVGGDELRKDQALFLELRLVRYLASCSATLLAETFLLLSKMTRT